MELIHRTVALLRLLCPDQDHADWGVSELADRSGLSLGTVHRLLETLQDEGLVEKDPVTRRYRLGFGLLEIGLRLVESLEVRQVAYPIMRELTKTSLEAVYLTVRDGMQGVSVERVDSPQPVRLVEPIGVRLPLHQGASRKVILAHLPAQEVERFFGEHPEARGLAQQLEQIRLQGCAMSVHEVSAWAASVAAPVFNHRGEAVAGLCISGPRERFTTEVMQRAIDEVKLAAAEISRLMGYDSGEAARRFLHSDSTGEPTGSR